MRLGRRQTELLRQLANPWLHLIVPDKIALSLARRGFLAARSKSGDGFYSITPDGLRVVADLMDAGAIEFPPPRRTPK
jgi:hypothetical protein